jgi:sugar lactone lactonase YvrE
MSTFRRVAVSTLESHGAGLNRPECVVPTQSGDVFVPEWPGGVTVVRADGRSQSWRATPPTIDLRPNGIALTPDGAFLIANLGDDGGVWRLDAAGRLSPFVVEVAGMALPAANFVTIDEQRRTWISVSTRLKPRQRAWRDDVADGFIVVVDSAGARIVAEGLHYTNEVRPDPTGTWLYVVETFGRRVSRFPIRSGSTLGARETLFCLADGFFPDGFAFDEEGGLWVTSLVSNRLLRFDGTDLKTILEDANPTFVQRVEDAFAAHSMGAEHLGRIPDTHLQQLTSVAFGGRDRATIYLGTLHGGSVYRFRAEVVGARPPHWDFPAP